MVCSVSLQLLMVCAHTQSIEPLSSRMMRLKTFVRIVSEFFMTFCFLFGLTVDFLCLFTLITNQKDCVDVLLIFYFFIIIFGK